MLPRPVQRQLRRREAVHTQHLPDVVALSQVHSQTRLVELIPHFFWFLLLICNVHFREDALSILERAILRLHKERNDQFGALQPSEVRICLGQVVDQKVCDEARLAWFLQEFRAQAISDEANEGLVAGLADEREKLLSLISSVCLLVSTFHN